MAAPGYERAMTSTRDSSPRDLRSLFDDKPAVAQRQTIIVAAQQPSSRVLLLASGWAARERVLATDRRAILDIYLPGDFVGLDHLFLDRAPDNVLALTTIGYHSVDVEVLRQTLSSSPALCLELSRHLAEEKRRVDRLATRTALLSAAERTAAGLHHVCERLSARGANLDCDARAAFKLPLTQQQLASYLGLHVMHLSRTLRTLRAKEVLKVERGEIVIEDPSRLAGFDKEIARLA